MLEHNLEMGYEISEIEKAYQQSLQIMHQLGYNTIQEAIADVVTIGIVTKSKKTWQEVDDVEKLYNNRTYINKAQAKKLGLEIIENEDDKT